MPTRLLTAPEAHTHWFGLAFWCLLNLAHSAAFDHSGAAALTAAGNAAVERLSPEAYAALSAAVAVAEDSEEEGEGGGEGGGEPQP